MRSKKEDKIIAMLNTSVDVNLDENYHNTLAKIRERSNVYARTPFKLKKGLSTSLVVVILIVCFSLSIIFFSTMGVKKSASTGDDFYPNDKAQDMDHLESASSNTIYGKYIEDSIDFDITYLYVNGLNKVDVEVLFKEYNIKDEPIEEINTYTIIIGKVDGIEKLAYTNGNECKSINLNNTYSIYDIYLNIKAQANKDIKNISLYIESGDIVYYYSDGINVYKYIK